jgi:hypothetical protein
MEAIVSFEAIYSLECSAICFLVGRKLVGGIDTLNKAQSRRFGHQKTLERPTGVVQGEQRLTWSILRLDIFRFVWGQHTMHAIAFYVSSESNGRLWVVTNL